MGGRDSVQGYLRRRGLIALSGFAVFGLLLTGCGGTPPPAPQDVQNPPLQIGVLTSSSTTNGPQCTATVVDSSSGRVIVTARHCVQQLNDNGTWGNFFTGFAFAPGYNGTRYRFTEQYPGGTLLYRVTSAPVVDTADDVAFLTTNADASGTLVEQHSGGLTLGAPAQNSTTYTVYAYDVNWMYRDNNDCAGSLYPSTDICVNQYSSGHTNPPHFCTSTVSQFTSLGTDGYETNDSCGVGSFASGGPWLDWSKRQIVGINKASLEQHSSGSYINPDAKTLEASLFSGTRASVQSELATANTTNPTMPSKMPASTTRAGADGSGQALVSWTPAFNGGSSITDYRITAYDFTAGTFLPTQLAGSTATQVVYTGLTDGHQYNFAVAAENHIGVGTPAFTNTVTPPNTTGP